MAGKWTDTEFDPTPFLKPSKEVVDFFGEETDEQKDALALSAKEDFEKCKWAFITASMSLSVEVPQGAQGYWEDLNSLSNNQVCNAARQIYRLIGQSESLNTMIRARYGLLEIECPSPWYWLALEWDEDTKKFKPAEGTNWADQHYPNGPIRPDIGDH